MCATKLLKIPWLAFYLKMKNIFRTGLFVKEVFFYNEVFCFLFMYVKILDVFYNIVLRFNPFNLSFKVRFSCIICVYVLKTRKKKNVFSFEQIFTLMLFTGLYNSCKWQCYTWSDHRLNNMLLIDWSERSGIFVMCFYIHGLDSKEWRRIPCMYEGYSREIELPTSP